MNRILIILLLFLAPICWLWQWQDSRGRFEIDFYQVWAVDRMLPGIGWRNLYSPETRELISREMQNRAAAGADPGLQRIVKQQPMVYNFASPFLYLFMKPFAVNNYGAAVQMYRVFSLACMALALALFARRLRMSLRGYLMSLIVFTFLFEPARADLWVGNINQIQLAGLGLFCWFQRRTSIAPLHFVGALILGLTILLKPVPVFVAPLWLGWLFSRRQTRQLVINLLGLTGAVIVAMGLSAWFIGNGVCWRDWLVALARLMYEVSPPSLGNYALANLLQAGLHIHAWIILFFVFFTPILIAVWRSRCTTEIEADGATAAILISGLGCLVYMLSQPLVWAHYYTLCIPALLAAFRPPLVYAKNGGDRPQGRVYLGALTLILFGVALLLQVSNPFLISGAYCLAAMMVYSVSIRDL